MKENLDYYIENGLLVTTQYALRERGFCCRLGCRHCPYGFGKGIPDPEEVKKNYPLEEQEGLKGNRLG